MMKPLVALFALITVAVAAESTPLPAIKGSVELPAGWSVKEEVEEGTIVYQFSKPAPSADSPPTAIVLSVTTKLPERAEMKPSQYAAELMGADDAGTRLERSQEGKFEVLRVEHAVDDENGAARVVNVAKANDATGTLYFVTWEAPATEPGELTEQREKILASLKLDPAF